MDDVYPSNIEVGGKKQAIICPWIPVEHVSGGFKRLLTGHKA